jgi:hypothetical protein
MREHGIAERSRRHFRDHYYLHGSNHFTCLISQDRAAEDPLGVFLDNGFQKTIHLAGSPCPSLDVLMADGQGNPVPKS